MSPAEPWNIDTAREEPISPGYFAVNEFKILVSCCSQLPSFKTWILIVPSWLLEALSAESPLDITPAGIARLTIRFPE